MMDTESGRIYTRRNSKVGNFDNPGASDLEPPKQAISAGNMADAGGFKSEDAGAVKNPNFELRRVYTQTVEWLFSQRPALRKPPSSLRMAHFLKRLGNPQKQFPAVHIAGTNGKGSVAHKIYSACLTLKVGIFSSPHLFDFRERIVVNQKPISKKAFIEGIQTLRTLFAEENLCFFEYATLLAFQHFARENVDIAIIETGIGGLYDSTNVLEPLLTIITSIGLDHQEKLGSTLDEIAEHKAGILRFDCPAILGRTARFPAILSKAKKITLIDEQEKENEALAQCALQHLKQWFPLSFKEIDFGIKQELLGRKQPIGERSDAVPSYGLLDGAHNPSAMHQLLKPYLGETIRVVLGVSSHREVGPLLDTVGQYTKRFGIVSHQLPYLVDTQSLRAKISMVSNDLIEIPSYEHLWQWSTQEAEEKKIICGSLYQIKKVLYPHFFKKPIPFRYQVHGELISEASKWLKIKS